MLHSVTVGELADGQVDMLSVVPRPWELGPGAEPEFP